ncbi:MAG: substrate-binding domain-containing protein, partial [Alphaproteobacteria bacterium]|nr:substrate-binding domain-containing protein [Alphaproteobacteria bacterium]
MVGRLFAALLLLSGTAAAETITLASTTSTENSGLFAHLLPQFERDTGIGVRVVAVGTGQAIRLARNGDADVVLVHHRASEEALVADGHGLARHDVMANDFVIVGPGDDPAGIGSAESAAQAFARIAETAAPFASRGDDSGTHKAERGIWQAANIDPVPASGTWYRELGAGMGATLNTAAAMGAYTLADRATWAAFANKGALSLHLAGDAALINPYGVIALDPARHPHVNAAAAAAFVAWLLSPAGQAAIAGFKIAGEQVF